jgi:hypothetical protein
MAGAPIRLDGTEAIPTELGAVDHPDAVLCRTNVGAIAEVMHHLEASRRVALAGGGEALRVLATAARDLTKDAAPGTPNSSSSPPGANCASTPNTT